MSVAPTTRRGVILAVDLLYFTQFVHRQGSVATIHFLDAFYRSSEAIIQAPGEIIKFIGDSLLAHYPADSVNDALAAAQALTCLPLPLDLAVALTFGEYAEAMIGLNQSKDIFGEPINSAFQLASEKGVTISNAFHNQLKDDKRTKWKSNDGASFHLE